jgi:hypothetical protein
MINEKDVVIKAQKFNIEQSLNDFRKAIVVLTSKNAKMKDICNFFEEIGKVYNKNQINYYLKKNPITEKEIEEVTEYLESEL